MNVVQGLPNSWELILATVYLYDSVEAVAWSPCARFIALVEFSSTKIEILDTTTLGRIKTLTSPSNNTQWLSFSPDGHLLTGVSDKLELINWDLQTGGIVSTISGPHAGKAECFSVIHSTDGSMAAVAYQEYSDLSTSTAVSTYNLISGTFVYSYHSSEEQIVAPIWTHNDCLQFATVKPEHITIWEVRFTSVHTLVKVKTMPAPDEIDSAREILFLPTLSRLAFTLWNAVLIWDAQDSRLLLNFKGSSDKQILDFSPDGQLFACGTWNAGIRIWKESPAGYKLHQELLFGSFGNFRPSFSPNGESIIGFHYPITRLWYTKDPTSSPTNIPALYVNQTPFILGFSPDKTFVAVTQLCTKMITILNLNCGKPQLTINTDMEILCLRVGERTVVVGGEGKIVTWNVPAGDCDLNTWANINDSVQVTMFDYPQHIFHKLGSYTSISPNFNHIVAIDFRAPPVLNIYDVSTGKCLVQTMPDESLGLRMPWFTSDGHEVWCISEGGHGSKVKCGWTIIEGDNPGLIKLDPIGPGVSPSGRSPWQSSCGYEVTLDGWVLSPSRKQLLWLPHNWRSSEANRIWEGQFLGLLDDTLPEAVILELHE